LFRKESPTFKPGKKSSRRDMADRSGEKSGEAKGLVDAQRLDGSPAQFGGCWDRNVTEKSVFFIRKIVLYYRPARYKDFTGQSSATVSQ
jgi:hypothetical protein